MRRQRGTQSLGGVSGGGEGIWRNLAGKRQRVGFTAHRRVCPQCGAALENVVLHSLCVKGCRGFQQMVVIVVMMGSVVLLAASTTHKTFFFLISILSTGRIAVHWFWGLRDFLFRQNLTLHDRSPHWCVSMWVNGWMWNICKSTLGCCEGACIALYKCSPFTIYHEYLENQLIWFIHPPMKMHQLDFLPSAATTLFFTSVVVEQVAQNAR